MTEKENRRLQKALIEVLLEDPSMLSVFQQKYGKGLTVEKLKKELQKLEAKDQQQ